jgi:solute carrier family 35, member E3
MESKDSKMFLDLASWAGNVSTSVLIVFVNKVLMSSRGYGFRYGE